MTLRIQEVLLDTYISYGSVAGYFYQNDLSRKKSGDISGNGDWDSSLQTYNIAYGLKTDEQVRTILDFCKTKRGNLFGFRFWNPVDDYADYEFFGRGDGTTTIFYLRRVADSGFFESSTISATATFNRFSSTNPNEFRDLEEKDLIEIGGFTNQPNNGLFEITTKEADDRIIVNSDLITEAAGADIRVYLYCQTKDISKPVVGGTNDRFQPDPTYKQTVPKIYVGDTEETNVTINEISGEVVFTTAPTTGYPLYWEGYHHYPAHFRNPDIQAEMEFYERHNINEILIDELLHEHPVGVFG